VSQTLAEAEVHSIFLFISLLNFLLFLSHSCSIEVNKVNLKFDSVAKMIRPEIESLFAGKNEERQRNQKRPRKKLSFGTRTKVISKL